MIRILRRAVLFDGGSPGPIHIWYIGSSKIKADGRFVVEAE